MRNRTPMLGGLVCLLMLSVTFADSQGTSIQWRRDMKQAYHDAQATGKPMFVQFTADWCGFCTKMDQSTFQDPQIAAFINETFIPLLVDKDKNEKFARAVGIRGLPTTVIISSQLELQDRLQGYQSSWELTKALSKYQRAQSPTVQLADSRIEQNPADPFVQTADVPPKATPKNEIAPSAYSREKRDADLFSADAAELAPTPQLEAGSDPFLDSEPLAPLEEEPAEDDLAEEEPTLPPLALNGYCLVSALDDRQLVEGTPDYGVVYGGRMIFFASNAHRETFIANPKDYWPANDGFCAVSSAETGKKLSGLLQHATVYRDQLWLFADDEARSRFMENPHRYLPKQDQPRR